MKLSLYLPAPLQFHTQGFGANANPLYAGQGLKGHTADDWGFAYNAPIRNVAEEAYCYSVMNKDNSDPMKYRAVFTLVAGDNGLSDLAEISYGHANQIFAIPGKTYKAGETLMTAGNTGDVYTGNHYVTKEEKLAGSTAGTHLHGAQVRPVKKVTKRRSGKQYLTDSNGYLKIDGQYFEVVDYNNGYNGCIDSMLFSNGVVVGTNVPAPIPPPAVFIFSRDLYEGVEGEDVRELQKYLNRKGYTVSLGGAGSRGKESTYFGVKTKTALAKFQKANGITPTRGYFGSITRGFVNKNP